MSVAVHLRTFLYTVLVNFVFVDGAAPDPKPNIVFVLVDDLGWNDIGYHSSDIRTPFLDQLANEGLKLENYYVQPLCSPSRSALMSGRYPINTGLQHFVIDRRQAAGLPLDSPTFADKMKEAGYSTHMVGKWHLGFFKEEYLPWNRGFDTFLGYLVAAEDHYTHSVTYGDTFYLDFRDEKGPIRDKNGTYSGDIFTEKAVELILDHDTEKPLFLYLAYQNVHTPLEVPERYLKGYEHVTNVDRRKYAGMVAAVEEGVANVTEALKEKGLWNNTILIFSSDNGGSVTGGASNYPLRGQKNTLWEGGLRACAFVTGGAFKGRGVSHELIHISDWFPTLVGVAKGNVNGTMPLDGFDQWETLSSGTPSKRRTILHNIDPLTISKGEPLHEDIFDTTVTAALRVGDMKLITGFPGYSGWWDVPQNNSDDLPDFMFGYDKSPQAAFPKREISNIQERIGGQAQERRRWQTYDEFNQTVWLFNITADPTEREDLSGQMPDMVREMLAILEQYNRQAVPPQNPDADPMSDPGLHGGVWGPWL